MFFTGICVAILLFIQSIIPLDMKKNSDKYGPYSVTMAESEVCHGPKLVDLAVLNLNFSINEDNVIIGTFFYNVTEAAKIEELKITVYNIKNKKKNILWNYKLTNPCKHFAIGATLTEKLHVKADNCVVKVGTYNFDLNITEAVYKFYGHSFFYGDYFFKLVCLSKKGNLGCMLMHQIFQKNNEHI